MNVITVSNEKITLVNQMVSLPHYGVTDVEDSFLLSESTKGNTLTSEVLDFLSKQKPKKLIRCQCGSPNEELGMLCDSCGEIVSE